MRKSKNRYFYHIFVSPGNAPGAITLNVVWMEREFDAYTLSRCLCRFWDRARYWSKIVIFSYPPCIRRPREGGSRQNITTPFGVEKLKWCGYPMVKKFRRYLYSFWRNSRTWQTDGQTPHADIPWTKIHTALMHMHRAVRITYTVHITQEQWK